MGRETRLARIYDNHASDVPRVAWLGLKRHIRFAPEYYPIGRRTPYNVSAWSYPRRSVSLRGQGLGFEKNKAVRG